MPHPPLPTTDDLKKYTDQELDDLGGRVQYILYQRHCSGSVSVPSVETPDEEVKEMIREQFDQRKRTRKTWGPFPSE